MMRSNNIRIHLCVAALFCFVLCACGDEPKPQRLPMKDITLGGRTIAVEVAASTETQSTGMMYRKEIGPDEGMLFIFPKAKPLSFYMRNTYVPLSIAFIRSDGQILNIEDMEPLSLETHNSKAPCRYALEMPQGWFERNGVKAGDGVVLPQT